MRSLFLFFCIACGWPALAQLTHTTRLELPVTPTWNEKYALLPLGERGGLVAYHRIDDYSRQPHQFRFIRIDTALATRWAFEFKLPEKYVPLQTFDNEQYLFHLYSQPNSEKIAVMRLNLEDGAIDFYDGQMPSSLDISQFKVMGNVAYLSGYYRSRPVVMAFSLFDRSFRIFQGLYVNHMELGSMEVDPFRQEVHVLTHSPKKRCQFTVRSYSPDGKPLRSIEYDGTQYSLITGKIMPISAEESLLVGNYSADCTPYSQGIYITRIYHNETGRLTVRTDRGEAIRYFDFSKLKNFFNYMNPKRQQKLLARVLKRRQLGKDYKFHYRLLVHELMPTPTGLRVAAEVYFPQYKSSPSGATFYNRNLLLNQMSAAAPFYSYTPRPVIDRSSAGYQYTHAFICEFDRQGNLVWDNCLPIKELSDMALNQKVQVLSKDEQQVVLAYTKDAQINTQLIERDSVLRSDEPIKMQTGLDTEKILSSAEDAVQAWYGPYFVATGYQKIIPPRGSNRLPRDVFYLNKLRYNTTPVAPVAVQKGN